MRSIVICPECRREYSFDTLTCPVCKRPTITVLKKSGEKSTLDKVVQSGSRMLASREYSFHSTITLSNIFVIIQAVLILVSILGLAVIAVNIVVSGNPFAKIEGLIEKLLESPGYNPGIFNPLGCLYFIVDLLVFMLWIYYSNANLRAFKIRDIEFSPGWAVGYFFIPIFNLIKPYSIVKEIWRLSYMGAIEDKPAHIRRGNILVGLWWGTFLLSYLLNQPLAMLFPDFGSLSAANIILLFICLVFSILLGIVSLVLSVIIVMSVSRKQQEMRGSA